MFSATVMLYSFALFQIQEGGSAFATGGSAFPMGFRFLQRGSDIILNAGRGGCFCNGGSAFAMGFRFFAIWEYFKTHKLFRRMYICDISHVSH